MRRIGQYLLIALLSACTPWAKISVTNVNNVNTVGNSSCLYALPLTGFAVTIVAQQESFLPGPYAAYAGKYLGIIDAVPKPYEKWTITNVHILRYIETDPDFLFSIDHAGKSSFFRTTTGQELIKDSLILLPVNFVTPVVFHRQHELPSERLCYTDLSIKQNFIAEKGLAISEIMPDSTYIKKPVLKEKNGPVVKTTEQKAEEAADFIIKIRKRRFKLITGQYNFMPDGESLDRALDELNHTESEYVSLFTGKRTVSTHTQTYHFVPESTQEESRIILFRFSGTEGFLDTRETGGKPVLVDIQDMNKTKGLDALILEPKEIQNQILYRIPDQAYIKISFGEQVLTEAMYPVYQFGALVSVAVRSRL
jgi:hypothetical protein